MLKKSLLLMLLMAFMAPWAAKADELTIYGDGDLDNNEYVPVYGYYADATYDNSQFIIPEDAIENLYNGTISGLTFYTKTASTQQWNAEFNVYLMTVAQTTLSNIIDHTSATVVYTGTLDATGSTMTISFTNNFTYTGGNLLIGFEVKTKNSGYAHTYFYGKNQSSNTAVIYYGNSYPSTATQAFLPKTTFTYTPGAAPTCPKPTDFEATSSSITSNQATLTWTAGEAGQVDFDIVVSPTELTDPSAGTVVELRGLAALSYTTPATLTAHHTYYAYVRAYCGTDDQSRWVKTTFTTACGAVGLTYDYNFSDASELECWTMTNCDANTGISSSQFQFKPSSDTDNPPTLITPELITTSNGISVAFDYKSQYGGDSWAEKFRVGYSTNSTSLSDFTWTEEITSSSSSYTSFQRYFAVDGIKYVAIQNIYNNNAYYLYIDNVSISHAPSCLEPMNLTKGTIDKHTAVLSWTKQGTATSWDISYSTTSSDHTNTITVSPTPSESTVTYTLGNNDGVALDGNTKYYVSVRSHCSDSDQSEWSNEVNFTTLVSCTTTGTPTVSDITATTATVEWTDGDENHDTWLVCYSTSSTTPALTLTATNDTYTVKECSTKSCDLTGLTPEQQYYYVWVRSNCGDVDGMSAWSTYRRFETPATCIKPGTVTCSDTEARTATLSWTKGSNDQDAWEIYVSTEMTNPGTDATPVYEATTNSNFVLPNVLEPHTSYYAWVRAVCSDTDKSAWSSRSSVFTTDCEDVTITTSWTENFDGISSGIPVCWDNTEGSNSSSSYNWNYYSTGHGESSSHCVRFNSYNPSNGFYNFLRTPVLVLPDRNMQLVFWYKNPAGGDFSVYIKADDETEKTELATGLTGISEWTEKTIDLSSYRNKTVYIYFKGTSNCGYNDAYIYLDDITIEDKPACAKPTDLAKSNVSAHKATLNWTAGGEETGWVISYSKNSDFSAESTTNAAAKPFTFGEGTNPSLDANSTYYMRVKANCDSDWSNVVSFTTTIGNAVPTGFATTDVASTTVDFTWTGVATNDLHASYDIYCSTDATMPEQLIAANLHTGIDATTYHLTGLTESTKYYAWVRDYCGDDGYSAWSSSISFTTTQTPVVVDADHPFSDNFEGANQWRFVNGELTNQWVLGEAANNGGTHAMYISNDNGENNAYTTNSSATVYFTKVFTLAAGKYNFSYDWRCVGYGTSDYFRVALAPASTELSASTSAPSGLSYYGLPSGWTALDGGMNLTNEAWQTKTIEEFDVATAGNYMMVFVWRNAGWGSGTTPAAIDNISISVTDCVKPTELAATNITPTSAQLSWTGHGESNWKLQYKKANDADYTTVEGAITTNPYTLSGLELATSYQFRVAAWCDPADENAVSAYSTAGSFKTAYGVPFEETFTTNTQPADWSKYTGTVSNAFAGTAPTTTTSGWGFSRTYCFREYHAVVNCYYQSSWNNMWLVTPNINLSSYTGDKDNLKLVFDLGVTSYNSSSEYTVKDTDKFMVLVSTDDGASWSSSNCWTWQKDQPSGTQFDYSEVPNTGKTYMLDMSAYKTGSVKIAFYVETESSDFDVHIDNVRVMEVENMFTKATTNGYWSETANWSSGSLPGASDNVVVAGAATINTGIASANNIVVSFPGSITIADGGQLICNNNPTVTVQKSITAATQWGSDETYSPDHWYFIASPISGDLTTSNLITTGDNNDYDLYYFDEAETYWRNYKNATFSIAQNHGYLYASQAGTTIQFSGTVQNDVTDGINVSISKENEGFNLVGNPFPFDAYVNRSYYTLDANGQTISATAVSQSNAIAPCTGIIVKAEGTENETVTFRKTTFNENAVNHGNLQMTLAQTVATRGGENMETLDNAIVSFNEGSQLGKFYFMQQNANIYIPQGNEEYAIVSAEAQGEMPVNFKAKVDGQYTLTVNTEDVEMDYLHLIDNIAGMDIDLLRTPSYTFNAKGDDYASRFRLVFSAKDINSENANDDFAFFSNGLLIITNEGEATLQVIDVTGRILSSEVINGSFSKTINAKVGVYVLRLVNGDNVKTQKIFVK